MVGILRFGKKITTPFLWAYARRNVAGLPGKFACVVSKRVSKSAVRRHYYQRWMREMARGIQKQQANEVSVVLVARPAIAQIKSWQEFVARTQARVEALVLDVSRTDGK